MKTKLIASRAMRYGTRALRAGDEFEASRRDARLLVAIGRASEAKEPEPVKPEPEDDIEALREEAQALGVHVDGRWGAKRLRDEIAKAREGEAD